MPDSSRCAGCGCDLLAKGCPVPGFSAAMQFVQRAMGKRVFICWHCAAERYKVRQVKAY